MAKKGAATKRESKGSVGRPRIEFDMDVVGKLAEIQCTYAEIAAVCGVSEDTITRRVAEEPEFAEAIKRGRESGKESLRRVQWKLAMRGHPTMLVWLGKQALGQKDRADVTSGDQRMGTGVLVVPGVAEGDNWNVLAAGQQKALEEHARSIGDAATAGGK